MNKRFKHYQVTLHDRQKHTKVVKVRSCVSPSAAAKVATYMEKMNPFHSTFRATMAYQLDNNGKPIWNQ